MASRGKIPDRWIPYKACGNVIEGTKIICFKVPINKRVQESVPEIKKIWDISAVLAEIPKLCAVIDLTNTARYYDPREFERANVRHKKIFMPGREIPPESKVQEFMDAVDEFLGRDCDSVVGVHCTHGLNRTGYMVCRYMRDRLNIPADVAIKRFEIARGYEIERENYKADLLGIKNIPRSDFGSKHMLRVNKMLPSQRKSRNIQDDLYENPFLDMSDNTKDSNDDDDGITDDDVDVYVDEVSDSEQRQSKANKRKLSKTQKRNEQKKRARLEKAKSLKGTSDKDSDIERNQIKKEILKNESTKKSEKKKKEKVDS